MSAKRLSRYTAPIAFFLTQSPSKKTHTIAIGRPKLVRLRAVVQLHRSVKGVTELYMHC